jgi:hypothetical protein
MDYGAYGAESPSKLRDLVKNYPGIHKDIEFWDDEFNSSPSWAGSDESVQAKYIPRGLVYNWAAGVRTFVWLLTAGTDGNEYDDFGLIHGLRNLRDDFTPRPVFFALQNTNALFSDTKADPKIAITPPEAVALRGGAEHPFFGYGFRSQNGKAIVAYWIAAHSVPGGFFPPVHGDITLQNTGIQHPVLIDVVSGRITPLTWKQGSANVLESLPMKDSVLAIADESYFNWPVLPEAPSSLRASRTANGIELTWEIHGGDPQNAIVERRKAGTQIWEIVAKQSPFQVTYTDLHAVSGLVSYRVRVANSAGQSAYSNVVRVQ